MQRKCATCLQSAQNLMVSVLGCLKLSNGVKFTRRGVCTAVFLIKNIVFHTAEKFWGEGFLKLPFSNVSGTQHGLSQLHFLNTA